ncbi:MAG: GAF domain-containing protein [Pseudomonadota bacterium]
MLSDETKRAQRLAPAPDAYRLSRRPQRRSSAAAPSPYQLADPWRIADIAAKLLGCASASIHLSRPFDPVFSLAVERFVGAPSPGTLAHKVLEHQERIVISDSLHDARGLDLIEAMAFPQARFLMGEPLRVPSGNQLVGALCLINYEPRTEPTMAELEDVACLAEVIAVQLAPSDGVGT